MSGASGPVPSLRGGRERVVLGLIAVACVAAALAITVRVLDKSVVSNDEWSYFVQAQIFSRGQLAVPSPPHREFFDYVHIVNNGRYYSKYPPGWPLLLAIGVTAGAPRVVNPLLAAATLWILYAIGTRLYGRTTGLVAASFALLSPYFLFHSASYFSHTASLFFVALMVLFLMRGTSGGGARMYVFAGLSGSASLLVRPFDQLVVLVPLTVFLASCWRRGDARTRELRLFGLAHMVGALLFLGYNTLQNGHPFVTGYQVADTWMDKWFGPDTWMWQYNLWYLRDLFVWSFPALPLLAVGGLCCGAARRVKSWEWCLASIFLALVVAYASVAFHQGSSFGPRYYYSGFAALPLLGARAVLWAWERASVRPVVAALGGAALLFDLAVVFPTCAGHASLDVASQNRFDRLVRQSVHGPALVFLVVDPDVGSISAPNALDFEGPIVYAIDRGSDIEAVIAAYPGRRYFRYRDNAKAMGGTLEEIPQLAASR